MSRFTRYYLVLESIVKTLAADVAGNVYSIPEHRTKSALDVPISDVSTGRMAY